MIHIKTIRPANDQRNSFQNSSYIYNDLILVVSKVSITNVQ